MIYKKKEKKSLPTNVTTIDHSWKSPSRSRTGLERPRRTGLPFNF